MHTIIGVFLLAIAFCPVHGQSGLISEAEAGLEASINQYAEKLAQIHVLLDRNVKAFNEYQQQVVAKETLMDQSGYYRGKTEGLKHMAETLLESRSGLLNEYKALCELIERERATGDALKSRLAEQLEDTMRITALMEAARQRAASRNPGLDKMVWSAPVFVERPSPILRSTPSIRRPQLAATGLSESGKILVKPGLDPKILQTPYVSVPHLQLAPRSNPLLQPLKANEVEQNQLALIARVKSRMVQAITTLSGFQNEVSILAARMEKETAALTLAMATLGKSIEGTKSESANAENILRDALVRIELAHTDKPLKQTEVVNLQASNERLRILLAAAQTENNAIRASAKAEGVKP